MVSNDGEDSTRILQEIEKLKAEKSSIEDRISTLQTQLNDNIDKKKENDSTSSCLPSSLSINGSSSFEHTLSPDMIYRYSRHLLLPSFGVQAQSKLVKSSILVVGAGGLGSPALLYLAASGVGRLGIVDHDVVELNNLHRQIIHGEANIGQSKVTSAAAACRAINSTVQIVEYKEALRVSNALEIVSKYDIVIDATDNAPSRYMVNDCCVVLGKVMSFDMMLAWSESYVHCHLYKNGIGSMYYIMCYLMLAYNIFLS
ncbi:Adenylyltransferase and sulfurtransferase mocs3 [Thalictrum thalictroides]|uniref:Adenylyltransferase and sulfurtransferase mocs3 n=1 Tax=Thalictrum thalictroides TaxID=46969 RepID=A0A7J6WN28_THATH|nr:Adenylyltransferase and sulfurtransferase mocs3 [Thalictrum thalictroides]